MTPRRFLRRPPRQRCARRAVRGSRPRCFGETFHPAVGLGLSDCNASERRVALWKVLHDRKPPGSFVPRALRRDVGVHRTRVQRRNPLLCDLPLDEHIRPVAFRRLDRRCGCIGQRNGAERGHVAEKATPKVPEITLQAVVGHMGLDQSNCDVVFCRGLGMFRCSGWLPPPRGRRLRRK